MASVYSEFSINVPPAVVWAALCDVGSVHRLFPGVLSASRLDGDGRLVTFMNGMTIRELIVDQNDDTMRFVYAAVEGGATTHHNASWQLFDDGRGGTRVVWISDFVPASAAGPIQGLVNAGSAAIKKVLEESVVPQTS